MIALSRLNGQTVAINPDLITWIEVTPDTTVSLLGGDKIIVRESLDEVIARVIEFRRAVDRQGPEYGAVLARLSARGDPAPGERSSPRAESRRQSSIPPRSRT